MEGYFHQGEVAAHCGYLRPEQITRSVLRVNIMNKQNRRTFLQNSAGAMAAGLSPVLATLRAVAAPGPIAPDLPGAAQIVHTNEGKKPLRLGLIIGIGKDPDAAMAKV